MTQDSVVWLVGLVTAIIGAVLGVAGVFDGYPTLKHYLELAFVVLGVISAYLKASPLPRRIFSEAQRNAIAAKKG